MKLVKQEVEDVTKHAVQVALLALAALRISGCPYTEIYENVEDFAAKLEKFRTTLELESIVPDALLQKLFSKTISKDPAFANKQKKHGIGFQLPDLEVDHNRMN